ncbi:hypothetical protein FDK38_000874 [Candidozyma auris]|nr:hypothetical protein FDK38_000874 [[Candida] auris]
MEKFIESSEQLLEAFPSATLSITYSNAAKKTKHNNSSKKAQNVVKFKCTEPKSGKCIQYSTYKAKELSRLLTFFGPRGVSKKRKAEDEGATDQAPKQAKSDVVGVASIMSNTKFEEPLIQQEETKSEVTPVPEENPVQPPSSSSKNKKKKKGKKK